MFRKMKNWVRDRLMGESMAVTPVEKREVSERGAVDLAGPIIMGIAMVFMAVGFIFFSILMSTETTLLAFVYTGNATINTAYFTGLTQMIGITPTLVLVVFLIDTVITGFLGLRITLGKASPPSQGYGATAALLSGLSIVFISIGLMFFQIVLNGVAGIIHGSGQGISASFTGFASIINMAPMLIYIGFVIAATLPGVLAGYSTAKTFAE